MHLKAVEASARRPRRAPAQPQADRRGRGGVGVGPLRGYRRGRAGAAPRPTSSWCRTLRSSPPSIPSLCTGLRGLAGVEVQVQGPTLDLHSGRFGGAVANPIAALAEILASLHDPVTRRVTVPGFYDDVREPSAEERELFAQRALRRRRVPGRGGRRAGHGRRGGLDRSRAALGASHARVQRDLGRLLGPGPEDDHPSQRRRQDHLPAGAEPGSPSASPNSCETRCSRPRPSGSP